MVDQEGGAVRRLPGPPAGRRGADPERRRRARQRPGRRAPAARRRRQRRPRAGRRRRPAGRALEDEGRTYGRDPDTVTARAGAFAAGLRDGRVEAVLKHFPGFGAATINTDDGAARVDLPAATLRRIDAAPYRAPATRAR